MSQQIKIVFFDTSFRDPDTNV